MIYGYARVSTDGQSVDAQVKQLRQAGPGKVFRETASGAELHKLLLSMDAHKLRMLIVARAQSVSLFRSVFVRRSILFRGPFGSALQVGEETSKSECGERRPL
jgi:hypothetical protein